MWELDYKESWPQKNWCFWTVGWRRLLRIPWTARRSNQSILKEIGPEYSLEGLMLKLKLHILTCCEVPTHWKSPWCWERLKAGREGVDRGWEGWMASATRWTWVSASSRSWWWTGKPGMLHYMGSQRVRHDWVTERTEPVVQWLGFSTFTAKGTVLILDQGTKTPQAGLCSQRRKKKKVYLEMIWEERG